MTLSRFPHFQYFNKNERFPWTRQCEQDFVELKKYFSHPPVSFQQAGSRKIITIVFHGNQLGIKFSTHPKRNKYTKHHIYIYIYIYIYIVSEVLQEWKFIIRN